VKESQEKNAKDLTDGTMIKLERITKPIHPIHNIYHIRDFIDTWAPQARAKQDQRREENTEPARGQPS
jgi:hypothetical protein